MKKPNFLNHILPFILILILVNSILSVFRKKLEVQNFDVTFIVVGNLLLFSLTVLGFWIQTKGASSSNVNAFLRGIYSSLLMKMLVVVGALFIYIAIVGGSINQNAVFTCMGLYILYTVVEVIILTKIVRKKPDA